MNANPSKVKLLNWTLPSHIRALLRTGVYTQGQSLCVWDCASQCMWTHRPRSTIHFVLESRQNDCQFYENDVILRWYTLIQYKIAPVSSIYTGARTRGITKSNVFYPMAMLTSFMNQKKNYKLCINILFVALRNNTNWIFTFDYLMLCQLSCHALHISNEVSRFLNSVTKLLSQWRR